MGLSLIQNVVVGRSWTKEGTIELRLQHVE